GCPLTGREPGHHRGPECDRRAAAPRRASATISGHRPRALVARERDSLLPVAADPLLGPPNHLFGGEYRSGIGGAGRLDRFGPLGSGVCTRYLWQPERLGFRGGFHRDRRRPGGLG